MKPDLLDQLVLGLAGTANQDFARVGQSLGDPMVVMLVFLGMAVGDAAVVVMQVNMGLVGQDVQLLDLSDAEMEDPGFVVVESYDGVIMDHAAYSFRRQSCPNP